MKPLAYYHVDVFSDKPLSGNGLIVFPEAAALGTELMQRITQEMRQFESIFLQDLSGSAVTARVFTCEEELDFAGHPVLGAAAILHDLYAKDKDVAHWNIKLNVKTVHVSTQFKKGVYESWMNQGIPEFGVTLSAAETKEIMEVMNLSADDLYPGHLPVMVSTGLPYLLLPLQHNAVNAKIKITDLEDRLRAFGAKFIGTLNIPDLSIRTWDNSGQVEDIATGSLVGPCGAYLVKKGVKSANEIIEFKQGYNLGRPSQLLVKALEKDGLINDVYVGGDVCKIARGYLEANLTVD